MELESLVDNLEGLGLVVIKEETDYRIDVMDSMSFISTVVAIENEYDIEFPDSLLTEELFQSVKHLREIILELQNENQLLEAK